MKQDLSKSNNQDKKYDFESEQNLIGLFALLYDIDKRNNPDLYKRKLSVNKETKQ